MARHIAFIVLLSIGLPPLGAAADDASTSSPEKARLDLVVPDVPAATALGVGASKVQHPGSLKDIVASIATGLSPDGKLGSTQGLELAPIDLLLGGTRSKQSDLAKDLLKIARSLRVSGAISTKADGGATTPSHLALGMRVGHVYNPDTDESLLTCLGNALPARILDLKPDSNPQDAAVSIQTAERQSAALALCRTVHKAHHRADFNLEFASVVSWEGTGTWGSLRPHVLSVWASASLPVGGMGKRSLKTALDLVSRLGNQGEAAPAGAPAQPETKTAGRLIEEAHHSTAWEPLLFVRYDAQHQAHGFDGQKDFFAALRLPLRAETWNLFLEGGAQFMDFTEVAGKTKRTYPAGAGGDVRLGDGTWLAVYFGADLASGQLLSLANLKWSLGEKAPF